MLGVNRPRGERSAANHRPATWQSEPPVGQFVVTVRTGARERSGQEPARLLPCAMPRAQPAPPPSPSPWHRSPVFAALLLTLAGVGAYHNSFGGPFIFDDEPSLLENPTLSSLWRAWWPPTEGGITISGRPLLNFSFAVNHALGGTNPWGYHLGNLGIHLAAGLALFGVVRRTLLGPVLAPRFRDAAWEIALAAAALWLLHPLQTESVTYVIQRAESLVGLLYLLTLYAFIRATATPPSGPGKNSGWLAVSVAACALGMLAKEVMATAPLAVLLYDRGFVAGSWTNAWAVRRRYYVALALTWLPLAGLVFATSGRGSTAGFGGAIGPLDYALTQVQAVGLYLRLAVWPSPLVLDYGKDVVRQWNDILLPALVLLPLLGVSLWSAGRGRAAGFCGVFFFLALAPSSSVVPVATQTMAEHRVYLPLAGLAALAAASAYRWAGRRGLIAVGMLAAGGGFLTAQRNLDYQSAIGIYEDTLRKVPDNARARARLADYYVRAGRLDEARRQLELSLATEPGVPEVLNNLGNVWQRLDQPEKAVARFREALALRPRDPTVLNNLGNSLLYLGQADEGLALLRRSMELAPDLLDARFNYANALAQGGRLAEAAEQFAVVCERHPQDADARNRYGNVLLSLGRGPEAVPHLEAAATLQPENPDYLNQSGIALARAGRLREALLRFEQAVSIAPHHPTAAQNAALARRRLGGG